MLGRILWRHANRRYLPGGLLNALWGLGRTNVRRITNHKFRYLLKYVTKGGALPEWVLARTRLRVFQSSRGFLSALGGPPIEGRSSPGSAKTRRTSTLGERLERWKKTALLDSGGRFQQVLLAAPFFELVAMLIFPFAQERRYLGRGRFQINDAEQLIPWIM